jgi:hypothetical protein
MRHRSSSVLKGCLSTVVLIAVLITVPAATSQHSVESAIIKVKRRADALAIANRYDVTLIDSIPEVNKYLVKGTSSDLNLLRRDPNVQSVEYDIATEISETVILNESTAALLDPNNVALLLDGGQTWVGHHWVCQNRQTSGLLLSLSPTSWLSPLRLSRRLNQKRAST